MEKNNIQLIAAGIIALGIFLLVFNINPINPVNQTAALANISTMSADLVNATGSVEVIIELGTPPGVMAVQAQDIFIQDFQQMGGFVTDQITYSDNAIVATVDASKLDEIAQNPNVKSIIKNKDIWFAPQSTDTGTYLTEDERYSVLNVLPLWEQGLTGKGVVVAVVDTGINSELPCFQRDGESIVIDTYNILGETKTINNREQNYWIIFDDQSQQKRLQYTPQYVMWHGTAVASCIASQDETIRGIAPGVELLNVEVFKPNGAADIAGIKKGWEWVAKWKATHPDKYVICSNSIGALPYDRMSANSLDNQANNMVTVNNIPMIVAAGNGHPQNPSEMKVNSPGEAKYVLTVGATDYDGKIAVFSCTGTINGQKKPDVVAPGVDIMMFSDTGTARAASGTSFATPLTAGVAALIAEQHKEYTAWQLENAIKNGANKVSPTVTYDKTYGYGSVDAHSSLIAPTTDPAGEQPIISTSMIIIAIVIIGVLILLYSLRAKKYER